MLKNTRSFVRHILLMTMVGIMAALYGITAYAAESGFEVPAVDSRTLTVQAADPHAYLMAFLTAYAGFIALIVIVALLFQCIARMFLLKKQACLDGRHGSRSTATICCLRSQAALDGCSWYRCLVCVSR